MLVVPKIKLVASIAFTALLTSFFLMFQLCLLESSCYGGLNRMAVAHKRAMYRLAGNNIHLNYSGVQNTVEYKTRPTNLSFFNQSATRGTEREISRSGQFASSNKVNETDLTLLSLTSSSSSYKVVSNSIYTMSTIQSISPTYKVISKSAYKMSKFFHNLRSNCRLPNCMEHLSSFDKAFFDYCTQKRNGGRHSVTKVSWKPKGECRFMRGEGRAPVALASLPGSGNTWVRGLLERATEICTGSVYCDLQLREAGFNGEEIRSGSVLVVKTHKAVFNWTDTSTPKYSKKGAPSYGAVILLVRNPYHALIAERNRQGSKKLKKSGSAPQTNISSIHTLSVGVEQFRTNPVWNTFIKTKMLKWITAIENVILHSPQNLPKLVVRYEDFQVDRVREVSRVLDFLNFPYSLDTLSQRLEEDFSVFHRKKHPQFQVFTPPQEQFIERSLRKLFDKLTVNGETYGIEKYITTL